MELTLAARKAITKVQLARWPKATKAEKGAILDAVCAVTGWHRDHARKAIRTMLSTPDPPPRQRRQPVRRYDDAAIELLTTCWAVLDGPCGKRLRPAINDTLDNLARHGHLAGIDARTISQVTTMSAATMDRRLAPARTGLVAGKGLSHTRPGSLLKTSIPLKTWAEWNDTIPGFLQIDLVGHEGGDNNGQFHYSLDATDIATGWTETITVRSKGERIVAAGLEQLQLRFPFHIAGIHSDNGSVRIASGLRPPVKLRAMCGHAALVRLAHPGRARNFSARIDGAWARGVWTSVGRACRDAEAGTQLLSSSTTGAGALSAP